MSVQMTLSPSRQEQALKIFPSGCSNGEFGLPPEQLVVIQRGEGPRLWDEDDNEFLDFSIGWGSCLVGHAHPEVVDAVCKQAANGSNFSYLNTQVVNLAQEIQRVSPASELLRFCASGTEAVMYCLRLARAFMGKNKILKFEGAYHGALDLGVTSLFPTQQLPFPQAEPSSAGTDAFMGNTLIAPYNDLDTTGRILNEYYDSIAAVIVEPLHRCTPPQTGFLEGLRALCNQYGLLLIFDEVVTGFRLAYGGAQEYYGVIPDLVAYGKALGGGYPIGAFGGRQEIMNMVKEEGLGGTDYVWMASTLGGNPVSCAAANAALHVYRDKQTYSHLHSLGEFLRQKMRDVLAKKGVIAQVIGDGPLAQIIFTDKPVTNYRSLLAADSGKSRRLALELFKKRIFLNPMGTKLYLSIAHNESICLELCQRLGEALDIID